MQFTKTAKIKILPAEDQKNQLYEAMKAYQRGCNFVSAYVEKTHCLVQRKVQKATYASLRSRCDLPSQMACNVVRSVIGAYKTLQTNYQPWVLIKFQHPKITLSWNRDYSLKENGFSIGTLHGRILCPYCSKGMSQYFDKERYRFGAATLIYKHGNFFLCVSVISEIELADKQNICNVVGIDRGINFVVTTYDSKHQSGFVSGRAIKQRRAHYKALRAELQKRQTPAARHRLKEIGQRENRWMQDVNHCISKALVNQYPENTMFVLEDLSNVRKATERVRQKDRYVSVSWSYYDLERKLCYKAKEHRQMVIKVNPAYTSQACPICGHTEKANRNKKKHVFCCKNCGYTSNDDRIAAINLYHKGIQYLVPGTVANE